jgi:pyruvate dehydrogenase E1 component alpha subunit
MQGVRGDFRLLAVGRDGADHRGMPESAADATDRPSAVRTTVASFTIERIGYLDADGAPIGELPAFAEDLDRLVEMYRAMWLTRAFDATAVALQRTGRLGTFASSLGQEAVSVGVGSAMQPEDVLVPSFREQGAQFLRGVSPVELLLYWGGDERGSDFAGPREDFPICVPIGTHAPHAVGVALAFQLRREPRVAVCVLGDGATSRGDVYEAMNFAGVRRLPIVFVVNNNQWAISVPRSHQSAATTLAQKGIAAGISACQVDGNDVIAVRATVESALERARRGEGPTLIEALTYRLADHTTADDASRYRSDDEVGRYWARDPIARLRQFLVERGRWGRDDEESLQARCHAEIEADAAEYLAIGPRPSTSMFEHLYAVLPDALGAQEASVARRAERNDG